MYRLCSGTVSGMFSVACGFFCVGCGQVPRSLSLSLSSLCADFAQVVDYCFSWLGRALVVYRMCSGYVGGGMLNHK
jgi:hypothetical protein